MWSTAQQPTHCLQLPIFPELTVSDLHLMVAASRMLVSQVGVWQAHGCCGALQGTKQRSDTEASLGAITWGEMGQASLVQSVCTQQTIGRSVRRGQSVRSTGQQVCVCGWGVGGGGRKAMRSTSVQYQGTMQGAQLTAKHSHQPQSRFERNE